MTRRRNTLSSSSRNDAEPQVLEVTYEQALKSFLLYNRIRNLSDRSIGFYDYNLTYFKKVFTEQELTLNLRTLTAKQAKEHFIGYMLDNGLAGNTINGRIKSCKAFFTYLYAEGVILKPLADQFDLVKAEKKMIQTFTRANAAAFGSTEPQHLYRLPGLRHHDGSARYGYEGWRACQFDG